MRNKQQIDFERFLEKVLKDLESGIPIRRRLPIGGRLVIDRPLPFICVYRQPPHHQDSGTARLITGEAAFLIAPGDSSLRVQLRKLLLRIGERMAARFGSFMVIEVWSEADGADPDALRGFPLVPEFRVCAFRRKRLDPTIETLVAGLGKIRHQRRTARVETSRSANWSPPGMRPLFGVKVPDVEYLGLAVNPIYRDPAGRLYPLTLRRLRRRFAPALRRAFHRFSATMTREVPVSFLAYGRRTVVKGVMQADRELSRIRGAFDLLLLLTPVNVKRAWGTFQRSRFRKDPVFQYRPLPVDPGLLKRALFSIGLEKIEDPTLADLFREIQNETDRQLTMLMDRGTRRFLFGSLQIYGPVAPSLLDVARDILQKIPPRKRESRAAVDAQRFAELAREEIHSYQKSFPAFGSVVQIRDDLFTGLMVSRGNLLIGKGTRIPSKRVPALLAHEVGTHCVTYQNGRAQKFRQLSLGLPNYDELQEGLAVTAEFLVGGLDKPRLRLLAARVVAASMMVAGASFVETFRELTRNCGLSQKTAFTVAMRVFRGGGLTKDAVYLKGLLQVLDFIGKGKDISPLYVGKISVNHLPVVRELQHREILLPAPVLPVFLSAEESRTRLAWLREGRTVLQLIEGAKA